MTSLDMVFSWLSMFRGICGICLEPNINPEMKKDPIKIISKKLNYIFEGAKVILRITRSLIKVKKGIFSFRHAAYQFRLELLLLGRNQFCKILKTDKLWPKTV